MAEIGTVAVSATETAVGAGVLGTAAGPHLPFVTEGVTGEMIHMVAGVITPHMAHCHQGEVWGVSDHPGGHPLIQPWAEEG